MTKSTGGWYWGPWINYLQVSPSHTGIFSLLVSQHSFPQNHFMVCRTSERHICWLNLQSVSSSCARQKTKTLSLQNHIKQTDSRGSHDSAALPCVTLFVCLSSGADVISPRTSVGTKRSREKETKVEWKRIPLQQHHGVEVNLNSLLQRKWLSLSFYLFVFVLFLFFTEIYRHFTDSL